eukprot:UN30657
MFSQYGDIVLGVEGKPPRFSTPTWFSMLFSAGVGIGLFFYGVSEPVIHYSQTFAGGTYPNRYAGQSRYERATSAMNLSWFHWGLAPSACYVVVGLPLAYYVHRKGMPCTMRTVFWPLLGDATWGIVGDLVDVSAIIGTMFGIATSLGLGVFQINAGINRLSNDDIRDDVDNKITIIWIITAVACVSVMTGLDYGIRRLSEGNFLLGLFVTGILVYMANTWYLLEVFVMTLGEHLWTLIDNQLHTDTYQRLLNINPEDNENLFMSYWTI